MSNSRSPLIEQLLERNEDHAASHRLAGLPAEPAQQLAVVACMDARLDVLSALGLEVGDAHVIRNAGGIVTDDVIRSLVLSQRRLGTSEIVVLHHTRCGVEGLDEAALERELVAEAGEAPAWAAGAFPDVYADVTASLEGLRTCPFLPRRELVRGFVYDVETGRLHEVSAPADPVPPPE